MAFKTIREILDYAKTYHSQLGDYYARLRDVADKERMKILLDYMSRHEAHMQDYLADYEQEAAKKVLDTWLKYSPVKAEVHGLKDIALNPDMSIEEVIKMSMKLDACLVDIYKEMADRSPSQECKDLFNDLLEMEKQEEIKCIRDTLLFDQI